MPRMASESSVPAGSAPARRRAAKQVERTAGKKETRERLLDVALELFGDKGYAETSLREIAAELGVSKAALYYHFESKADILMALHMRMHAISRRALAELQGHERDVGRWRSALNQFVEEMLSNRKLFEVHARNHGALEELHHNDPEHATAHDDMESRFLAMMADSAMPLETRARIAGAVGATTSLTMWVTQAALDVPHEEFAAILRRLVDDLVRET